MEEGVTRSSKMPAGSASASNSSIDGSRSSSDASLEELEATESSSFTSRPPRSARALSFGNLAAFSLLPIPLTVEGVDPVEAQREIKHLNLISAVALTVGSQVGGGIFSAPGIVTAHTGSVGASLLVWLGSGLLAWTGASSFAELGAAIPINGGSQAYLRYSYGPVVSYLYCWMTLGILNPSSAAIIAIVFGEYICRIIYHTAFDASSEESAEAIPRVMVKLMAMLAVAMISAMHAFSLKVGTQSQIALTLLKMAALFAVAIMGIVTLGLGKQSASLMHNIFEGSSHSPGRYALALYSGLWAFSGWAEACVVAGEMKEVERDLPKAIHISMGITTLLYLMANTAYFIVLPKTLVAHSNTVGLDFGKQIFGPVGGVVFALIVAVSCFGALNGSLFTSARLVSVSAKEGYIPEIFARLHLTRKTPARALALQAVVSFFYIAVGDFASLINFASIAAWLFYFLTVLGLIILRQREPNLPRPYKTWLITPITFCCVALFLLFMPVSSAPLAALAAFGFIAAGYPVYLFTQVQPPRRTIMGAEATYTLTWNEYLASKMHNTVGAIISLFKRDGRKDTQQGTAYEAVQVEDLDGDLQRTHSQDVPMREINRQ
ncbi:hypothetical protein P389DRAFT_54590 [Cystobasidium minutum MCA 4210]|uniref:uncharacterized protein n=1 Tax=Cystobasidium minutum MCA 4210 TaxID=1397322 RepID=UPI0034CDF175|eukprot:jgi/Rhomi1/54590/CE54589_374